MTDQKRPAHRPVSVPGGKRRNVYIDDKSWELAEKLGGGGKGSASRGIRLALELAEKQGHVQ